MNSFPTNALRYGIDQPLPERISLRAGLLTLFFENGDLRHIRYDQCEILRRVYVAVRDRNWGTVKPQIANLQICENERDFQITFNVICQENEIDFRWKGEIRGEADGTITFEMDGEAHSSFFRNRIGFCVLHPVAELADQPCQIEHTDGKREAGQFPKYISPHQPFKDIRSITHEIMPDLRAEVRMEGDTFEMEDQRNWTDASFKTYCTPLELPFPVWVQAGERVKQQIHLKLLGAYDQVSVIRGASQAIQISLDPKTFSPHPSLGLRLTSQGQPLTAREIERLRTLNLNHLRVDLWMASGEWRSEWERGISESKALDCALEIALYLTDNAEVELNELLSVLKDNQPRIARYIIFHEDEYSTNIKWVDIARRLLSEYDPAIPLGCGADSNFTELNRQPPPTATLDFLAYAANPQVHAFDNLSLIENLAGLGETVISAQKLAAGNPVITSPVTLKPSVNVVATNEENKSDLDELPAPVDPRQSSLFGAGWTLSAIKYLAENGVQSATFYETTGWRGLMETERGSLLPEKFCSIPGAVFPLYHVFADVGAFARGVVLASKSSDPQKVASLALRKGDQLRVLIANLDGAPCQIQVLKLPLQVRIQTLDETNVMKAMQFPEIFRQQSGEVCSTKAGCLGLEIRPYAITRIDTLAPYQ
jgi:hypothetical protein